jgi:hypothetical protein
LTKTLIPCLLWLAASAVPIAQAPTGGDEFRLKAAFTYRFSQFVEWPPASLDNRNSVEICVERPNHFGSALRDLVAGESLGGRPFTVRDIGAALEVSSCHVLFIPSDSRRSRTLLGRAARLPILTVGDSASFLDDGGIIQLEMTDRRVRFAVDLRAAARSSLTLSSQLLRLASNVRGEP